MLTEKEATVTVTKMYKDGQLVVADTSNESTLKIGLFQTTPATVSVQATHTKNLGNYQSLKIGVIVSVPSYVEEIDDAHDFAVKKVSEYLANELKAIDGDSEAMPDVTAAVVAQEEAPVFKEEPKAEPKKKTRKKAVKEDKVEEEDHIPDFSAQEPVKEEPKAEPVQEAPAKEAVVEEQEVSVDMVRGMDFDSLVGLVEANELSLDISAYTNSDDGRKALAEDIIDIAFPEEKKVETLDATEALADGKPVEEPVAATPVETKPAVEEQPKTVVEEMVSDEEDAPYTFEELSDYSDADLQEIYAAWDLGAFPEKRSMAIKRILEVQSQSM